MKKLFVVLFLAMNSSFLFAQDSLTTTTSANTAVLPKKKKDWSKIQIDQAGDHFMVGISSDHWSGAPDSIGGRMGGLSRGLNIAVMLNKPFKSDPRWSVAFGVGISSSSMFFKKTNIDIAGTTTTLRFTNLDSASHFKKYKLATTFVEVPIELRYTFDPTNQKKSWKLAAGVKVGTMLNAHTKGKTFQNSSGSTLNNYTLKEAKRTYFNGTRLAATARVGIGNFSLFGAYSITSLIKDVAGPEIHPYQLGLMISGL